MCMRTHDRPRQSNLEKGLSVVENLSSHQSKAQFWREDFTNLAITSRHVKHGHVRWLMVTLDRPHCTVMSCDGCQCKE